MVYYSRFISSGRRTRRVTVNGGDVNAFTDGRNGDSTIGMTLKVEVLGIYEM